MKRPAPFLLVALGVALAAAAWLHASGSRARAGWLEIEAPPLAVPGRPLAIRVTLRDPAAAPWISVDVHGTTPRREPRGVVASAGSQPTTPGSRSYLFEAPLPADEALGSVTAVVYLSESGRWDDRVASAASEPIPVRVEAQLGEPLRPVRVYELGAPAPAAAASSRAARLGIAAGWLLVGVLLARRRPRLALACLAACAWELSGLETRLVAGAREIALAHRVYYERRSLQELITMAALLGAAVLALARLRPGRARDPERVQAMLWLYAGLSLARLLSWHAVDRLLDAPLSSVPVVQVAKLATALAALGFAVRAGRTRDGARSAGA